MKPPVRLCKKPSSKRQGLWPGTDALPVVLKPKNIFGTALVAKLGTAIRHDAWKSSNSFSHLQALSLGCKLHTTQANRG
jgi:hypothetical protein